MENFYKVEALCVDYPEQGWRTIAFCNGWNDAEYVQLGAEWSDRIRITRFGKILSETPAAKEELE